MLLAAWQDLASTQYGYEDVAIGQFGHGRRLPCHLTWLGSLSHLGIDHVESSAFSDLQIPSTVH